MRYVCVQSWYVAPSVRYKAELCKAPSLRMHRRCNVPALYAGNAPSYKAELCMQSKAFLAKLRFAWRIPFQTHAKRSFARGCAVGATHGFERNAPFYVAYKAPLCKKAHPLALHTKRSFVCNAWVCMGKQSFVCKAKQSILKAQRKP